MNNNQQQTPLYSALKRHALLNPVSFHVPGHKYGAVLPECAQEDYSHLLKLDATELNGLDDLHQPESVILEAQRLAADLYGVDKTFFLVNGSTVGNLAMIFATCQEDEKVIVQRNCHKSIMHALQLVGAAPVFLSPRFDENMKVASYIPYEDVKQAIERYPDAKALILTNPNYYGMTTDLTNIVQLAHRHRIPVLIDEAHGAHFVLGHPFPKSAIACGADVVVQSAHKTLPAMTMGSYLHVNGSLVDQDKIKYFLQIFQSSSPSYPIMASLDFARKYVASLSVADIDRLEAQIRWWTDSLNEIEAIAVVQSQDPVVTTDLLKITIQTRCALSGYELQRLLEREGIFTELADPFNVLFVHPLAVFKNAEEAIKKIKKALAGLSYSEDALYSLMSFSFPEAAPSISYQALKRFSKKFVHIEEAEGLVAAETIIPYPPGIPMLLAGEVITKQHIQSILELQKHRSHFQGGRRLAENQIEVLQQ